MKVTIINENGMEEALFGLGLSFGITSGHQDFHGLPEEKKKLLARRAVLLAGKGKGHDKFLRMLSVTLDITAPVYWWNQFDTYKVGTTAQSESKMHTLLKSPLQPDHFEGGIEPCFLERLETAREQKDFDFLLRHLPMSFLQRRIVTANYAVLRNILEQRHDHKLWEWRFFCARIWVSAFFDELFSFEGLDSKALLANLQRPKGKEEV